MGFFVILITALSFIAGTLKNELILTFAGTVFLVILAYCFLGVFISGVIFGGKAKSLSLEISPETVNPGEEGELRVKTADGVPPGKKYFLRFPAILIRAELLLETRDGRVIRHYAEPGHENASAFSVTERGAYFHPPEHNGFIIFDAPGFFKSSFPIYRSEDAELLALPSSAGEAVCVPLKAGGNARPREAHFRKSDDLADHRPYVPGDDPRRINWKLYGHAPLGELFVREEETIPPPYSRLVILADTEADISLYSPGEARKAVDMLCETVLATAAEYINRGMDISIGYTGGGIANGIYADGMYADGKDEHTPMNTGELAPALARPFAIPWPRTGTPDAELPRVLDIPVVIFALPRVTSGNSALDRFLGTRGSRTGTNIIFLYDPDGGRGAELEASSRICVNLYNGRSGVHAAMAASARGGKGKE